MKDSVKETWEIANKLIKNLDPKVSLKLYEKGDHRYVYLRFTIPTVGQPTRVNWSCHCDYSVKGINDAIDKAKSVSSKLSTFESFTEFKHWYDTTIKERQKVSDDRITFSDAINKVDDYFWSLKGRVKDKNVPGYNNWMSSWETTYGKYFNLLPPNKLLNLEDINKAIIKKSDKARKNCIRAMIKLCDLAGFNNFSVKLKTLSLHSPNPSNPISQSTTHRDLQTIGIKEFLSLYDAVLEYGDSNGYAKRYKEHRRRWLWVFSMQVIYGMRVHEVFSIMNIYLPYTTKDGVTIPALKEKGNKDMVAVVGTYTVINTTTKTHYRLCVPNIHPEYPEIINRLAIREGQLPDNRPLPTSLPSTIQRFFANKAFYVLSRWQKQLGESAISSDKPFTQTHALRHLSNYIAKIGGKSPDQIAMSLGHSVQMNTTTYMKRGSTEMALDLLTSRTQSLPLQGAVSLYRSIFGSDVNVMVLKLIASIYGVDIDRVKSLLDS